MDKILGSQTLQGDIFSIHTLNLTCQGRTQEGDLSLQNRPQP